MFPSSLVTLWKGGQWVGGRKRQKNKSKNTQVPKHEPAYFFLCCFYFTGMKRISVLALQRRPRRQVNGQTWMANMPHLNVVRKIHCRGRKHEIFLLSSVIVKVYDLTSYYLHCYCHHYGMAYLYAKPLMFWEKIYIIYSLLSTDKGYGTCLQRYTLRTKAISSILHLIPP